MDTALVLRRRVLYGSEDGRADPSVGHEGWEYWWSHPPGLFWTLDAVLRSLGVPDDLLADLLKAVGPDSRPYRALMQLARSACERVRLRVQVADAPPDWQPPAGWEPLSRPRDEYLYLWRVVRNPEPQAMRAAVQAASKAVEHWRRFGGWL